jgi:hypothetical protein
MGRHGFAARMAAQILAQRIHGGIATIGVAFGRFQDNGVDFGVEVWSNAGRRADFVLLDDRGGFGQIGGRRERQAPGQCDVQDDAERVDVASNIGTFAAEQFRRRIAQSSEKFA